jgi:hypothetical protein
VPATHIPVVAAGEHDDIGGRCQILLVVLVDVLDIGRLQEGVDAGEMGQLAARERGDALVDDGVRTGQPKLQPTRSQAAVGSSASRSTAYLASGP